jgi:hypothetical protein
LTHVVHPPYLAGTGNDRLMLLGDAAAMKIPEMLFRTIR